MSPTSAALRDFIAGAEPPFTAHGIAVTTAKPGAAIVAGHGARRSAAHLVTKLAVAWSPNGPVLGARWTCGGGSVAASLLTEEQRYWHTQLDGAVLIYAYCQRCQAIQNGDTGPVVYRVWDKTGDRLLYIGSTSDWPNRRSQHRSSTWWWPIASTVDLEHHSTIEAARKAEIAAIRKESPRMNVQHTQKQAVA